MLDGLLHHQNQRQMLICYLKLVSFATVHPRNRKEGNKTSSALKLYETCVNKNCTVDLIYKDTKHPGVCRNRYQTEAKSSSDGKEVRLNFTVFKKDEGFSAVKVYTDDQILINKEVNLL